MIRARAWALFTFVMIATSCSSSSGSSDTTQPAECDSATPITESDDSFPEVQGIAQDATIFGLLFPTQPPPIPTGELKVVWRMTGEGDLTVTYESPDGKPGELTFGPEAHSGSSYTRPGEEWGTGFLFDEPGCWHIHLKRTVGSGDVWINVVAI